MDIVAHIYIYITSTNNDLGPPLLLDVETFCSVIVWTRNSKLPCEDVIGYTVRLYNPDSEQELIHNVPKFLTHYILTDEDKLQLGSEAYVQVCL